jgi:CTP:molybdopterin cytidylyltransferase MocA
VTLAIVLAAGRGRRLGTTPGIRGGKALIDLGGRFALARCLDALSAGGADELRVVLGDDADDVAAALGPTSATLLVNEDRDRGQTSSLRVGLADGPGAGEAFLLHTVDHPLARAEDVAALLAAFATRPPGVSIVAPSVDGRRGHPTAFAADLADEFLALADDEPAHTVVRRDSGRVLHVEMDDPWLVRDIDTPEDLAAARAAVTG